MFSVFSYMQKVVFSARSKCNTHEYKLIGVIFYQRVEYVTTSTISKTALLLAVGLRRLA